MSEENQSDLKRTKLFELHLELGAKLVPFAGYQMPVQYPLGVLKEHLHTRAAAGLFDVSHMGQVLLHGDVDDILETLIPQNVRELELGRQRYGFFTNAGGGIADDLMFARRQGHIFMVVNAACKDKDFAHLKNHLGKAVEVIPDRSLLALQGPAAEEVLASLAPEVRQMRFMEVRDISLLGAICWVSRSGYTGEDGFEISVPDHVAVPLARALLQSDHVEPIGLGARDSLRLEAGLSLYGHELDETTSPIEANLLWAIQKRRRQEGGFFGEARILGELKNGPSRLRVGLRPEGRAPMREGVALYASENSQEQIGAITSGGFGPSVEGPIAMGYVEADHAKTGSEIWGELRGKRQKLAIVELPFLPANFKR